MALIAVLTTLGAQGRATLGYCAGEISKEGSVSEDGRKWISSAVFLPATMLEPYLGSQITAVKAGLANKTNIDSLKVWVRSELTGVDLSSATITAKSDPRIARGWNEIELATPVDITEGSGLYIGFSYHQKASVNAVSSIGTRMRNGFFALTDPDGEWQDFSAMGILSCEAVVNSDYHPDHDLGMLSALATLTKTAGVLTVTATLINNGSKDADGFTLSAYYENEGKKSTVHFAQALPAGEKTTVTFDTPAVDSPESGQLMVGIEGIDYGSDQVTDNNVVGVRMVYLKRVLIEEFTTEKCGNCPRVAGYLHDVLGMEQYSDRAYAICRHAGFYTDWLTQELDEELRAFFRVDYAPAMMMDRYPLFQKDGERALHICPTEGDITNALDTRLDTHAHVGLSLDANYDPATRNVEISVSGERDAVFCKGEARLVVCLLENGIEPQHQAGAEEGFLHQHVQRASNGTWGTSIAWDINTFRDSFSFDIDDDWDVSMMEIVAYVCAYNPDDMYENSVENCVGIKFPQPDSVESVSCDETTATEYYTVEGLRIQPEALGEGLYIRVDRMSDGSVKARKVMTYRRK